MGRIQVSAILPAPVTEVWNVCKDVDRTPEWYPAVQSVRVVGDRREGVGAEYDFTARNVGRTVTYRVRVTDWQEGLRVRQEVVPGHRSGLWSGLLESMTVVWEYTPTEGGTRLTAVQEMKLKGPADLLTQPWLWLFDRQLYRRAFRQLADVVRRERN